MRTFRHLATSIATLILLATAATPMWAQSPAPTLDPSQPAPFTGRFVTGAQVRSGTTDSVDGRVESRGCRMGAHRELHQRPAPRRRRPHQLADRCLCGTHPGHRDLAHRDGRRGLGGVVHAPRGRGRSPTATPPSWSGRVPTRGSSSSGSRRTMARAGTSRAQSSRQVPRRSPRCRRPNPPVVTATDDQVGGRCRTTSGPRTTSPAA